MAEAISRNTSVDVEEEEEVFEITDFTTVSDWEKFIAQISEAVTDWQLTRVEHVKPLNKHELTTGTWEQTGKEIRFSNAIFMLTLFRLKQSGGEDLFFEETEADDDELQLPTYMDDMMSIKNDFPPRAHCLVRWYGFRSFLTLSLITSGNAAGEGLISESKCNLLLSSACIMLSDTGCEVPIFIQIQQNWRKLFTGRCIGIGMQTEFEMVHLRKCPVQYQHLSGLLHVFKSKIGKTISPVQVSTRFTYTLSRWGDAGVWPVEAVDPDVAAQTLDEFFFGCLDDPIGDLQLSAVWPSITEDLIIENDLYSDFNPLIAPVWTIKLLYTDNPECLLSGYLKEMLKLSSTNETFGNLVKTALKNPEPNQDIGQALSKLTDSSHKVKQMVPLMPEFASGISKLVTAPKSVWANRMRNASHVTTGPVNQSMMELIMEFLLPEDNESSEKNPESTEVPDEKGDFANKLEHQIKSAPKTSLTYRLGTCLTVMNYCHGGLSAVSQVWHEFVQELRYRFENGILLSGIGTENPDLRCCLLHQKLEMLNCCIQHKIKREMNQNIHIVDEESDEDASESKNSVENKNLESSKHPEGAKDDQTPVEQTPNESTAMDISAGDAAASSNETGSKQQEDSRIRSDSKTQLRKESSTSLKSGGWQDEVSSLEDEFFDCDDGDSEEEQDNKRKKSDEDSNLQTEELVEQQEQPSEEDSVGGVHLQESSALEDRQQESADDVVIDDPTDHTVKPSGRLKEFGNANLLNFDVPLYIPITQEPPPLTEDVLEEQTKIFSSLGDSVEGASLRRKMQSASLLSDMESFKAANPGCVLADFVRWYSPRDYEEKDGSGHLSDRMRIPGNLWRTMWDTAKSVPARRQKRLFDDTKEGEKVLHFLTSLQPKDLILQLLSICFHEAIGILQRKSPEDLPSIPTLCGQIQSQASKLFQGNFKGNINQLEDLLQKIQFTETLIARVLSLKHKFANVKNVNSFVRSVIENPEVILENAASGEAGNIIKQYFLNEATASASQYTSNSEVSEKVATFPPPRGREYILRSTAPKPSEQSRPLPHRMYAVLMKNEFRLAGAFSSDTVFF